jgi:hypothetical protein
MGETSDPIPIFPTRYLPTLGTTKHLVKWFATSYVCQGHGYTKSREDIA